MYKTQVTDQGPLGPFAVSFMLDESTIVEQKSLAKLIIFFIGISNKLITILAVFLFSLLKRLHMVIIQLKDIKIFLSTN